MAQRSAPWGPLIGILLVAIVVVGVLLYLRGRAAPGPEPAPPAATAQGATTPVPAGPTPTRPAGPLPAVPTAAALPTPEEITFHGCPPGGDGTDPELNRLKNRVDVPKDPLPIAFSALLHLPWPPGVNDKHMAQWSPADRAAVDQYNGLAVSIEGYLAEARAQGPESTNCHSTTDVDFHIWLVERPGRDRSASIITEATPRGRAQHPAWTVQTLQQIARDNTRVRITGWTMLDPEHPEQVGKTRGTLWEIHPITEIEYQRGTRWVDLDSGYSPR